MTRIKICGIRTLEDALLSSRAGAHALGFNFSKASPRYITPEDAREIIEQLPPFLCLAGVFVESEPQEINEICSFCALHVAQLHSEQYSPEKALAVTSAKVIRVFRAGPDFSVETVKKFAKATGLSAFLFDAYRPGQPGGTGKRIENRLAQSIFRETEAFGTGILAGGLTPENVAEAVRLIKPYAVDTASGVEASPGKKNRQKIYDFVGAVEEADRSS